MWTKKIHGANTGEIILGSVGGVVAVVILVTVVVIVIKRSKCHNITIR